MGILAIVGGKCPYHRVRFTDVASAKYILRNGVKIEDKRNDVTKSGENSDASLKKRTKK